MGLLDRFVSLIGLSRAASKAERRGERGFVPTGEADAHIALRILVCAFDGPGGTGVASRLSDALSTFKGTEILFRGQILSGGTKGPLIERLTRAGELAQDWLTADRAHVCIWGAVDAEADNVSIHFATLRGDTDSGFGLGDRVVLPFVIDEDMARIVHAGAVCAGALAVRRQQATALMAEQVDAIAEYIDALPRGLEPHQQASNLICIGNVMLGDYALMGNPGYLHFALQALEAAVAKVDKDADPLTFALAQSHRARALQAKAGREESTHSLAAAEEALTAAAAALDANEHPNDRALAYIRLGNVIYKRYTRDADAKILKGAITAYDTALKATSRKTMPGRWSETMNQMGVVLLALGEATAGTKVLERAVLAFRKTLEVRKREYAPVLWAQTANNLGAAAFSLAKRSKDAKHLAESKTCFRGAMEVYAEQRQDKKVAIIRKNLDRVERMMNAQGAAGGGAATGGVGGASDAA
jgi:tetratricopeptide (TPR) repeat protein